MTGGFNDQLTDGSSLAAMMIGCLGYRFGRVGTMALGTGNGVRALSVGTGLALEVSSFELSHRALQSLHSPNPNLWRWSGPAGLRQGLFSSFLTFGALRGAGHLAQGENFVFRHLLQDSAMVFGHQASGAFNLNPRPTGSLSEQFLHAEATNLQMGAAMTLGHAVVGGRLHAAERGLDLALRSEIPPFPSLRSGERGDSISLPLPAALSTAAAQENSEITRPRPVFMASLPPTGGEIPSGPRSFPNISETSHANEIRERFYPILSRGVSNHYAREILQTVLSIPFHIPGLHERSLEVMAERSDRGMASQLFLARSLYEALVSRPLDHPTRSYSEALIHLLCIETLSEASHQRSRLALHRLFNVMEGGSHWERLENLAVEWGYDRAWAAETTPRFPPEFFARHASHAAERWTYFRPEEQTLLWNMVYRLSGKSDRRAEELITIFGEAGETGRYSMEEVRKVLDSIRERPLGGLRLQRLLQILTVEDIPEKLRDLNALTPTSLSELFQSFDREGLSPEEQAHRLNPSAHTAHFNDLRLARKVVSVMGETLRTTLSERDSSFRRLLMAYYSWMGSERSLDAEGLISLLQVNPSEQVRSLVGAYLRGGFQIVFISGQEFDQRIAQWGQSPNCRIGFFYQAVEPGEPHRIFLREMPQVDASTPEGNDRAFAELTNRMKSLVHEWEHWRHVTGNYEGIETASEPIPLSRIGRRERLISEIMAYLEEYRWRYLNLREDDLQQIAFRLGETLPLFLRNFADHSYFSRTNERMMRELWGDR